MRHIVLVLALCTFLGVVTDELAAGRGFRSSGEVTGSFRLGKQVFCVGEPIPIEVLVVNDSKTPYRFFVGGDYRGTLRHSRFSFTVRNTRGRDFTRKQEQNQGGLGQTVTVEAGRKEAWWQLLNPWTHLLPPGHYRVRCLTRLADDSVVLPSGEESRERSKPIEILEELQFEITPYSKAQILTALDQLKTKESVWGAIDWAWWDIGDKFQAQIVRTEDDSRFEKDVVAALPRTWNDRYFMEYELTSDPNRAAAKSPEDFWLTFSVLNNSNRSLPTGVDASLLLVNGREPETWRVALRSAMITQRFGLDVRPGECTALRIKGNDFLSGQKNGLLRWTINGFSKSLEITLQGWK
jgi:hypothetical protein